MIFKHSDKFLPNIIEMMKKQAMKSPINNKYCALLMYRNKIIDTAYNTFKRNNHVNLKQCVLCQ